MIRHPFDRASRASRPIRRAVALFAIAGCTQATMTGDEPAGAAVTLWTDSTELFMEYPALIVGQAATFAVHLTDLTDFAPLRTGKITLRFMPRDGGAHVSVTQDAPRSPGIYGPAPEFTHPGVYDLALIVESPQARDSIAVPGLRVYASTADVPAAEEAPDEGIAFLKEQQWNTPGFSTAVVAAGTASASFDASGEIVAAPGRLADVATPVVGLLSAEGLAQTPAPGTRVSKGQVLAFLTPSLGEAGNAYAEARARLREAEHEYERAKRLFEAEAVPQRRLHEAAIRLDAAREALAGLSAVGTPVEGGRIELRAPISGVLGEWNAFPGARVAAGTALFTIVDPGVVWLRVRVPAAQTPGMFARSGGTFRVEGLSREFTTGRLISLGNVIDSLSRTVPVLYEVMNPGAVLRLGSAARVSLRTGQRQAGVLIPTAAILDEDGRPIAYVQTAGETFERRLLTLGAHEGPHTLVLEGIRPGERVVSGAAFQVRLASLSTALPAHGHEH